MTNLVKAWTYAKKFLESVGVDSPTIDARLLVMSAANVTRNDIVTDPYREISDEVVQTLESYLKRREAREPVAHIIGKKGFWNLELISDKRALVPRPETEVIVDYIIKNTDDAPKTLIDLGTGTGAIILALLAERENWTGIGVDISKAALSLAMENADFHGMNERATFIEGDWSKNIDAKFDIVVSNPPYIPSAHIETLDKDVKDYDPHLALDGGEDGLEPYHILFKDLEYILKPEGIFAFEFGFDQKIDILKIAGKCEYLKDIKILKDLSDHDRVIIGKRK